MADRIEIHGWPGFRSRPARAQFGSRWPAVMMIRSSRRRNLKTSAFHGWQKKNVQHNDAISPASISSVRSGLRAMIGHPDSRHHGP